MLMKRIMLLAATMTLTVLVVGGVAWALTFTCNSSNCVGTPGDDVITGNDNNQFFDGRGGGDHIEGRGGGDTLDGGSGRDDLIGDGQADATLSGADFMFGRAGTDSLEGQGGPNEYHGGSGPDTIDAAYPGVGAALEDIFGGPGNDDIVADDDFLDIIDCGGGSDDKVDADVGLDVVRPSCETVF